MSTSIQAPHDLEERARRILTNLRGAVVDRPDAASPRSGVVLVAENAQPIVVHSSSVDGIDQIAGELAEEDDGVHYPALLWIDDVVAFAGWMRIDEFGGPIANLVTGVRG